MRFMNALALIPALAALAAPFARADDNINTVGSAEASDANYYVQVAQHFDNNYNDTFVNFKICAGSNLVCRHLGDGRPGYWLRDLQARHWLQYAQAKQQDLLSAATTFPFTASIITAASVGALIVYNVIEPTLAAGGSGANPQVNAGFAQQYKPFDSEHHGQIAHALGYAVRVTQGTSVKPIAKVLDLESFASYLDMGLRGNDHEVVLQMLNDAQANGLPLLQDPATN